MNRANAPSIDQLQELALPAPAASYWPQTWGWAVLAVLLLALTAMLCWRRYQRWRRARYRREALAQLQHIEHAMEAPSRRLQAMRLLPELIKRVALSMPQGEASAALSGEPWQAFLQAHSPQRLPGDLAQQFACLAYAPPGRLPELTVEQRQQLFVLCREWIEAHHVAA